MESFKPLTPLGTVPELSLESSPLPTWHQKLEAAVAAGARRVTVEVSLDLTHPFLDPALFDGPSLAVEPSMVIRGTYDWGCVAHDKPLSGFHVLIDERIQQLFPPGGPPGTVVDKVVTAHVEAATALAADIETMRARGIEATELHDRTLIGRCSLALGCYGDAGRVEDIVRAYLRGRLLIHLPDELNRLVILRDLFDIVRGYRAAARAMPGR